MATADQHERQRDDAVRLLAIAADFARIAERHGLLGDRVTIGYRPEAGRELPRSWRARARPRTRRIGGRGWVVRRSRQADAPPIDQSSITITQAGRVLLDADWQPNMRELSLSGDEEVLVDEYEDMAALERQISSYLAQRLAKPHDEIRFADS